MSADSSKKNGLARVDTLLAILDAIPGNSAAAQRKRIQAAMERLGSVTSYEFSRYLDCYDPRTRIYEMRRGGTQIKTVMRAEQTESGVFHRVGLYMLDGAHHA